MRAPRHRSDLAADGPRRSSRPRFPWSRSFTSPRAWAFTLLGLDAYCGVVAGDLFANRMRGLLADRLMSMLSAKKTPRLALVRGRARLRQRAPSAGADPDGPRRRARRATSRPAGNRCVGSCRFRPRRRDASGQSGPRASAEYARHRKRSISSRWRRQQRFPPAFLPGRWIAAPSGGQGQCGHSIGFWARTICRQR